MAIDLCDVHFHYADNSNSPILNIPSWSLGSGEHAFIHGPSGCGKSTLLNLLSGLLSPTEGSIKIFDERLDQMNSRQRDKFRANNIGFVFQQFNLIPYLDAIDNIKLANQFSESKRSTSLDDEIKVLLTTLNMPEKNWRMPIRSLSIGQQQRIAIARALINKPRLLIADEPTSSLDQANRDAFMALLLSIANENKITLLFVSHDMLLATHFKRVESLSDINKAAESAHV